jgi:ketosteroid isomerase-like protein
LTNLGTISTAITMMESMSFSQLSEMRSNPDYLITGSKPTKQTWNGTFLTFDKGHKHWLSHFVMEAGNMRYVRRSNHLLGFGDNFQYREGSPR